MKGSDWAEDVSASDPTPVASDLTALRAAILAKDREFLLVLKERMALVDEVAAYKLVSAVPMRDQSREDLILRQVRELAIELGMDAREVERLYRVVLEMSLAAQQEHIRTTAVAPLRVAYQGVEGAYSHLAAQRRFGGREGGVLLQGHPTFIAAAEAVLSGSVDLALLPIENSTAGSINETYDLLASGTLVITGEVIRGIDHCLIGIPGADLDGIERVLSHPQALLQCSSFLQGLPGITSEVVFDTAGAARTVKEGRDPHVAAIASATAAEVFGLEVLATAIQDQTSNATRFVEVAREPVPIAAGMVCKTSLVLRTAHKAGALAEVLAIFAARNINLTKLESRPVPDAPFSYRFYLDIEGHRADEAVAAAILAVEAVAAELKVLGSYPRAEAI